MPTKKEIALKFILVSSKGASSLDSFFVLTFNMTAVSWFIKTISI